MTTVFNNAGTPQPKWKTFDRHSIGAIPQLRRLPTELVAGIRLATLVFPFKVNEYALENLIDWSRVPDDPMFRLLFPVPEMLCESDLLQLTELISLGASQDQVEAVVERIRASMNPDPSEQSANAPFFKDRIAEGIQHKYLETVLAFPKQGQTCHSYCSFCFRWPQFVRGSPVRFELDTVQILHRYLRAHPEVSDLLLTGGDPLIMNSRRLASYLEPLRDPALAHVKVIRLGTKALTYWPHCFLGRDSDALISLLRGLVDAGKHIALMAHINHWQELIPAPVEEAIARLRQAGVVIRTQSPLLRGINDDAETWQKTWSEQVRLGLVPYYMFVERDTGAMQYFRVPLARALQIYQDATQGVSGLGRTARGPVMSVGPGKVHIVGTLMQADRRHFVLNFIQARDKDWLNRLFLAEYSEEATWIDHLRPSDGSSRFFFEDDYSKFLLRRKREAGDAFRDSDVDIEGSHP